MPAAGERHERSQSKPKGPTVRAVGGSPGWSGRHPKHWTIACLTSFKLARSPPCIGWGRRNCHGSNVSCRSSPRKRPSHSCCPATSTKWARKALRVIARELERVPYLKQIVVGIDGATRRATSGRRRGISSAQLPQKPTLLWNDGPRMSALVQEAGGRRPPRRCAGARGATCGSASATCWPANRRAWWRCTIATSSPTAANCWRGFAIRWRIRASASTSARATTRALLDQAQRPGHAPAVHAADPRAGEPSSAQHPFLVYLDTFRYPLARGDLAGHGPRPARARCRTTGRWRSACWRRCSATARRGPSASPNCARTTTTNTRNFPRATRRRA